MHTTNDDVHLCPRCGEVTGLQTKPFVYRGKSVPLVDVLFITGFCYRCMDELERMASVLKAGG